MIATREHAGQTYQVVDKLQCVEIILIGPAYEETLVRVFESFDWVQEHFLELILEQRL